MYSPHQNHSILNTLTSEEFEKHAIIKPPEHDDFIENDKKFTRVAVDSYYRNQVEYPDPNNYYFDFEDDINDVASAKLISMEVPLSTYTINKYFNKLVVGQKTDEAVAVTIDKDGVYHNMTEITVTLNEGNYDVNTLADMIETQLNHAGLRGTFTVTYNSILDKYTFSSNKDFWLFFTKTNSLHPLLGFKKQVYASNVSHIIVAPYRCNLDFNNYIVMCIDQFDNNKSNLKPLHRSFAIIGKNYGNLNIADEPNIMKSFNPPLARLARIHITFFDKYGNPYDFQNMDHRFEILFQSYKQRRKYQGIFGLKK